MAPRERDPRAAGGKIRRWPVPGKPRGEPMPTVATRTTLAAAYIPSTARIVARLVVRDGLYHAAGRYYASAGDAALMRRTVAARTRSDAIRGVPSALRVLRALLRPAAGESRP